MKFIDVITKVDLCQNVVNLYDVNGLFVEYDVTKDNDYDLSKVTFRSYSVWNDDDDDELKMIGEYSCMLSDEGSIQYYYHNEEV